MKSIFRKKNKLYIKFFQKIFFYDFNTIMKLFFSIVYIRIISLRWKFDDHPLVEWLIFRLRPNKKNITAQKVNFLGL